MASTKLYLPKQINFSGTVAAGSGQLSRGTYTVPNGQIAEIRCIFARIGGNANAVGTTNVVITTTLAGLGVNLFLMDNSGIAAEKTITQDLMIDLDAADSVTMYTTNNGVNPVVMQITIIFREYQ